MHQLECNTAGSERQVKHDRVPSFVFAICFVCLPNSAGLQLHSLRDKA